MNLSPAKIVGIAMLVAAVVMGWPATSEFFAVDACLDAGGSFNYVLGICDLKVSQPYVSSPFRSPWLILLGVVLGLVGLVVLVGKYPRS